MITIRLKENFGNNLFQYATGINIAHKHSTHLILDVTNHITRKTFFKKKPYSNLKRLQINAKFIVSPQTILNRNFNLRLSENRKIFTEKAIGFDQSVLSLPDNYVLDGFFQSPGYFKNLKPLLQKEFQLKKKPKSEKAIKYEASIIRSESVGVHIRRGDYVKSKIHNVCRKSYYFDAIKYAGSVLNSPKFFIFSDDIEWCKINFSQLNVTFIETANTTNSALNDFHLLRKCRHNIISNSTFSWWPAWLNDNDNKLIIAPSRWYNEEKMNTPAVRELITPGWKQIKV